MKWSDRETNPSDEVRLTSLAKSAEEFDRWEAALSLAGFQEEWAFNLLNTLAGDSDEATRTAARAGLAKTKAKAEQKPVHSSSSEHDLANEVVVNQFPYPFQFGTGLYIESLFHKYLNDDFEYQVNEGMPFPQADDFQKVYATLNWLESSEGDASELADYFHFDIRQASYYLRATEFLGFIKRNESASSNSYELTSIGRDVLFGEEKARIEALFRSLLRVPSVAELVARALTSIDRKVTLNDAIEVFEWTGDAGELADSTIRRRAQTVLRWSEWLLQWLENSNTVTYTNVPSTVNEAVINALQIIRNSDLRGREALFRKNFLLSNNADETLDSIGEKYGVTRERIRQLEKEIQNQVLEVLAESEVIEWFRGKLGDSSLISFHDLQSFFELSPESEAVCRLIFEELGFERIKFCPEYFSTNLDFVLEICTSILGDDALTIDEFKIACSKAVMPENLVFQSPSSEFGFPQVLNGFVVRKLVSRRAVAKRIVFERPGIRIQELSLLCGESSLRNFEEGLRRTGQFSKDQLGGIVLAEDPSAIEATSTHALIQQLLEEQGSMRISEIHKSINSTKRISESRVQQLLDHRDFGFFENGKVGLTSMGARRKRESEPKKPIGIVDAGNELIVGFVATFDMIRGSGFTVPKWLAWRLELHATPEFREFKGKPKQIGQLKVTRRGGVTAFSAVRGVLAKFDIVQGCEFEIHLNLKSWYWYLSHGNCSNHS